MKRVPLLFSCLVMAGSLSGCVGPGGGGYTPYQYPGYGPRYDDYYGYGPSSRWGYADRRVRPGFVRQMPPGGRGRPDARPGRGGPGGRDGGGRPSGRGPSAGPGGHQQGGPGGRGNQGRPGGPEGGGPR